MSRTNVLPKRPPKFTHEGARASGITPERELRRTVMACLLWEDTFYEDGVAVADRITNLTAKIKPEKVAAIALEARSKMHLRHVPLKLCADLAVRGQLKAEQLTAVIQRPDEITEFCSILLKQNPGKNLSKCLSHQCRKGLAAAFCKFNEYSLAKHGATDGAVKLRDVVFLCRPTSNSPGRHMKNELTDKVVAGKLATPDTWEVALSASKGQNKMDHWYRLIQEDKLGGLAYIRNLRNMKEAGVDKTTVLAGLQRAKMDRVLPFRFISAARAVPEWEDIIEPVMLKSLSEAPKLVGKTCLVVDNSGSMHGEKVSAKSDIDRSDAACALAILLREICEDVTILSFSGFPEVVPSRRGFGLAEAIKNATSHGGTYTEAALIEARNTKADRIIVVTDEQSHERVNGPGDALGYFVNVAVHQNGIGYGDWVHVDGWSEAILDYVRAYESVE